MKHSRERLRSYPRSDRKEVGLTDRKWGLQTGSGDYRQEVGLTDRKWGLHVL